MISEKMNALLRKKISPALNFQRSPFGKGRSTSRMGVEVGE
jgi:hypothetical protein